MSDLPSGPLPSDYKTSVAEIIKDVGISVLTMKLLRKRLEAKYNIDFSVHSASVHGYVQEYMQSPEIQRELAKAKQAENSPAGGKGKRGRPTKEGKAEKPEKKAKKEKKPEDYPKSNLTAYMIFGNDNREKMRTTYPDAKITEIASKIGEAWQQASDSVKESYKKRAEADKERFDRELEQYLAAGGSVHKRGAKAGKAGKKEKDPNAPKRGLSAYLFYTNEFRTKNPSLAAKDQMKEAAAAWKKLSEEEKRPYEEKAAKDKERYEREQAAYSQ